MVSESGLYWMRTTRRAEESERDSGLRGGKRDWKDFMRRVRCEGVLGEGGGKEARTSCTVRCFVRERKMSKRRGMDAREGV